MQIIKQDNANIVTLIAQHVLVHHHRQIAYLAAKDIIIQWDLQEDLVLKNANPDISPIIIIEFVKNVSMNVKHALVYPSVI